MAWVQWGLPLWSDEFEEKLNREEIILGGCCISEDSRKWKCHNCGKYFGDLDLPNFKGEVVPDYIAAHEEATCNAKVIKKSSVCGCFMCVRLFSPMQIHHWVDDIWSVDTALCPDCEMDSVIGDASGYPVTEEFLRKCIYIGLNI